MTTGYILDVLEGLNIELTEVQPNTGVIGLIRGGKPGPTVALRADIDALPVEEAQDHAVRSQRPGIMHACGHDTHTAALLGAAMALSANKEQLKGNILLIFQSAEETSTGAQAVMDTGVLEAYKPAAFLSLHMIPAIEEGKVGVRTGPIMAAQKGFTVTVKNVKISAGAGFVVVLTGDIMTMPGLPKAPAAERIDVDDNGTISGLF